MFKRAVSLVLLLVAVLVAGYVSTRSSGLTETVRHLLAWVEQAGSWGLLAFCGTLAATVVLLLPGIFLSVGAGFLYGSILGTAVFVAGETLGAMVAFWLGRTIFATRVRRYFHGHPKLGFFNESLADEGWKFIALTRMTPFFPFKLSNYLFGSLGFRFRDFFWGTLLGTLPLCFTLAYLGSLLPDLTGLESHSPWSLPLGRWSAFTTGTLAVAGLILISRRAQKNFRKKLGDWEKARGGKEKAVV